MKKVFIILSLLVGLFSCTQSNTSDSGLTELTINDITKDLNTKMNSNEKTQNIKISYVTLKISPNDKKSTCTPEKIVPKTEITEFNSSEDLKSFTLNTSCLYTLNMEYGSNDKAYFVGETTIGKKISDKIDNSYNNAGQGKTTVTITLTFKQTGQNFSVEAAEGTTKTTNVVISATLDNNDNSSTDPCLQKIIEKGNNLKKSRTFYFCYKKPESTKSCYITENSSSTDIPPIEIFSTSDDKREELQNCTDSTFENIKALCNTPNYKDTERIYIRLFKQNNKLTYTCIE